MRRDTAGSAADLEERGDYVLYRHRDARAEEPEVTKVANGAGLGEKIEVVGKPDTEAAAGGQVVLIAEKRRAGLGLDEATATVLSGQ